MSIRNSGSFPGQLAKLTTLSGSSTGLLTEGDKVRRHSRLGTDIAELTHDAQKQRILLPERASILTALGDLSFQRFLVGIGDFGERSQPEQDDEKGHKAGDAEICPLDVLQSGCGVGVGVGEEDS